MNRFSRMHLSPADALRTLDAIDLEEKGRIAEGIALIAVIDHRRDYLAAGYSCMRSYCMSRLRMSEDKANRRIQVARAALRCPELFECLADGRLSVTTASVLAPHLEPDTAGELLRTAAFQSRYEIVRMLSARSRAGSATPVVSELDVQTTSCQVAPVQPDSYFELDAPAAEAAATPSLAPPHANNVRRGRVTPAASGDYDVRLSITPAEHDDLRRAQALLGHAVLSGDPALVYARAMRHYLVHLEKQRLGAKPGSAASSRANGRHIPKALRRFVWERDGGRCTFVSADGHRCEETSRLQFDHVVPRALGGETTAKNLRLLCRAHNAHEAERVLGRERVQERRELAQRERARERVAAAACAARAKARAQAPTRDAAQQARHDDLVAALRNLSFSAAEARQGAKLVDAMPDAPLEACLRAALADLTRPLVLRGERMARSGA